MSKVLIVVDMQNDFVTGPLGTPEAQVIVLKIKEKIVQYKHIKGSILRFTRDTHSLEYLSTQEGKNLPIEHCIEETIGWNIIPELSDFYHSNIKNINKYGFGYCDWDYEFGNVKHIESIELVGVCTDICVISNALILKSQFLDVPIVVDASCCAGTTPENHAAALQVMKCCQIEVIGEK